MVACLSAKRRGTGSDMATERKKRALVLTGAGASLEFGAPGTAELTKSIETKVCADEWMRQCGGAHTYLEISKTLKVECSPEMRQLVKLSLSSGAPA